MPQRIERSTLILYSYVQSHGEDRSTHKMCNTDNTFHPLMFVIPGFKADGTSHKKDFQLIKALWRQFSFDLMCRPDGITISTTDLSMKGKHDIEINKVGVVVVLSRPRAIA